MEERRERKDELTFVRNKTRCWPLPAGLPPHHSVCALDCCAPPWVSDTLWMWPALFWGTLSVFANSAASVVSTVWPHGLHTALQAPLSMGFLKTGTLEWVATPSSRGSSWPRDQTCSITSVFCIAGRSLTTEPPKKPTLSIHGPKLTLCFLLKMICGNCRGNNWNEHFLLFVCFKESCKGEGIWGKKATEDRDTRENKTQFYKEILQTSFIWFSLLVERLEFT